MSGISENIFVDVIVESPFILYGYCLSGSDTLPLLQKIFSKKELGKLLLAAMEKDTDGGIHIITKYRQFVVLVHMKLGNDFEGAICFVDCKDEMEAVLKEYPGFPHFDWTIQHRREFHVVCSTIHLDKELQRVHIYSDNHQYRMM